MDQYNQMGFTTVIAQVARDLWQCKPTLSLGYALGFGLVYCHKSLALCYNYYAKLLFIQAQRGEGEPIVLCYTCMDLTYTSL